MHITHTIKPDLHFISYNNWIRYIRIQVDKSKLNIKTVTVV